MIPKLYAALSTELSRREPYLRFRTLSEGDRQRQGLALADTRHFIAVLENHILERTASVVFSIELTEDCCTLRFCRPVTQKEHDQLEASGYVPRLSSKVYLSVGTGTSGGILYAWAAVKISQYSSVIDLFDALFLLGKELEKLLLYRGCLDGRQLR